jgi:hypothetical protein
VYFYPLLRKQFTSTINKHKQIYLVRRFLSSIVKMHLRDKLEAKKRRQKQQRTNKNRKKTHRKLKVNEPFNDLKKHRGVTIRTTMHVLL